LLNKERRILSTFGDKKDKPGLFKYKLYRKEGSTDPSDLITSDNWIEVLRSQTSEQFDLWMEREVPRIELTADFEDHSGNSVADQTLDNGGTSSFGSPLPNPRSPEDTSKTSPVIRTPSTLLSIPSLRRNTSRSSGGSSTTSHGTTRQLSKFTPFLQWPLEEDNWRDTGRTPAQRVRLWLDNILKTVLRSHPSGIDHIIQAQTMDASGGSLHRGLISHFAPITGSTRGEVQQHLFGVKDSSSQDDSAVAASPEDQSHEAGRNAAPAAEPAREVEQVFKKARHLLKLFVPEKLPLNEPQDDVRSTAEHELVRIYWGLQDRIIAVSSPHFHREPGALIDFHRAY
jgi:hypothetical protein